MSYNVLDVCRHVINYSNDKNYGISNLKLQKILYLVQAYFLISNDGNPCFNERIEAWEFGPVVPEAYDEYKQYGSGNIPRIKSYFVLNPKDAWNTTRVEFCDNTILPEDKQRIDKVVDEFADYSATDLVALTHNQSPWIDAYVPYQNNEITLDAIRRYFNEHD